MVLQAYLSCWYNCGLANNKKILAPGWKPLIVENYEEPQLYCVHEGGTT